MLIHQCITLCLIVSFSGTLNVYAKHESEYERQLKVKAAFILNLVRFSQWPEIATQKTGKKLLFCLYQYNWLQDGRQTLEGKTIKNHIVQSRVIKTNRIEQNCDVILVPASELQRFLTHNDFQQLHNKMTITDMTLSRGRLQSLENKVIFRLIRHNLNLRFEVNKTAAQKLNVNIGSELLKLGNIISDPEKPVNNRSEK